MKSNDWHTDAERLAALLDGKLSDAEREKVLAQLATSPEDLAVLADASMALPDARQGESSATSLTSIERGRPSRRFAREWLAIAAVVAGISVLPVVIARWRSRDDASQFVRFLGNQNAGFPAGWDFQPWGASRSSGAVASSAAIPWRVGARLTDLELAVAARDPIVPALAREITTLLSEIPAAGPAIDGYRKVEEATRGPHDQLQALVRNARASLTGLVDTELLDLGAWVEAARIGSVNRDTSFFAAGPTGRMLESLAGRPDVSPTVKSIGLRVRDRLADPRRIEWESIARDLTMLLADAAR